VNRFAFCRNIAIAAALIVISAGCAEPTTGRVTGAVTVDGKPAEMGSIALIPLDGRGSTAGAEIVDGRYEIEALFNHYKVEIRVPTVVGQKKLYDVPDSPVRNLMAESLPPRYHDDTELRLEITPGETRRDFQLTTD
jgi:hypothetical protein